MCVQEERAVGVDGFPHRPRSASPFGNRPVEIDQPESAGLVAGAHRIPRIDVDRFRAAGERAPHPHAQIGRRDGAAHAQRDRAESRLQLADPPCAASGGSREIEERAAPRRIASDSVGVLRIERCAPVIDGARRLPIVRISVAIERAGEKIRRGGVARRHRVRQHRLHTLIPRAQILGHLLRDEEAPVDVVRVRQDRAQAVRLHVVPRFESAIPRAVEGIERAVLVLQPFSKTGDGVRAEAKLRVPHVRRFGPVDDVRLAPEIPSQKRRLGLHALGKR